MTDLSRLLWFTIGLLVGLQLAKVLSTEPLSRESKVKPIPPTMDFGKQKAS